MNPVLDGIDDHIARLKQIEPWGYNTAYAISAKYNLHRNYAEFLLDKGRLRAKQINQILGSVEAHKKTAYDQAYIEKLYQDYQNHAVDDTDAMRQLAQVLGGRNCLILAPGASILEEKASIDAYIARENPVVLSANFVPEGYAADYVFCCNAMRFETILGRKQTPKLIVTSNLLEMCTEENVCGREILGINYVDLSFDGKEVVDNSVIMLIRLLKKLDVTRVSLAGFDGYRVDHSTNYVADYMASQHTKGEEENRKIRGYMGQLQGQMEIQYLTKSLYVQEKNF